MSKHAELRKHLDGLGISRNNMRNGTVNGKPAIYLYKDGNEYQFTGYTDGDIFDGIAAERDSWLKKAFGSNPAAAALGSISTAAKAAAARENGKRGGRPSKVQS